MSGMIQMADMTMDEVVFSHRDTDGTDRHFNITRLLQRVAQGDIPVFEAPVDRVFAMHVAQHFGIEQHRYQRLTVKSLRTPILVAGHEGAEVFSGMAGFLIDGCHRYVYAAAHGVPTIRTFIVPQTVWDPTFLVDVPSWLNDLVMPEVVDQTAKSHMP